jgi:hypothetical protein
MFAAIRRASSLLSSWWLDGPTFCGFVQRQSHASEDLLFREPDHLTLRIIRYLGTLNGASRQSEADSYGPE